MRVSATGAIPGKFLVDVLPWLKYVPEWVPGANFQRLAKEWKEVWRDFTNTTFQMAVASIVSLKSNCR